MIVITVIKHSDTRLLEKPIRSFKLVPEVPTRKNWQIRNLRKHKSPTKTRNRSQKQTDR